MIHFDSIRAITFDCYGTLIDWESGILSAVRPVLAVHGATPDDADILTHYAMIEPEEEVPYKPYREVLRATMRRIGEAFGVQLSATECDALPNSLRDWNAFPETPVALQALASHYALGVISNVDDDLFAYTRPKLGVDLSRFVSAQFCRSYKPALRNFRVMLAALELEPRQVLHVAESLFHDVAPASTLGMPTVWVNRRGGRERAAASRLAVVVPDLEVASLSELVRIIGEA